MIVTKPLATWAPVGVARTQGCAIRREPVLCSCAWAKPLAPASVSAIAKKCCKRGGASIPGSLTVHLDQACFGQDTINEDRDRSGPRSRDAAQPCRWPVQATPTLDPRPWLGHGRLRRRSVRHCHLPADRSAIRLWPDLDHAVLLPADERGSDDQPLHGPHHRTWERRQPRLWRNSLRGSSTFGDWEPLLPAD